MLSRVFPAILLSLSTPAIAETDEIEPVPAQALIGHAYFGENVPSRILFINVRDRPVRIFWIMFDGSERPYGELAEGQQLLLMTFVAHRWVIRDAGNGTALEGFISTHSGIQSGSASQIALIR